MLGRKKSSNLEGNELLALFVKCKGQASKNEGLALFLQKKWRKVLLIREKNVILTPKMGRR